MGKHTFIFLASILFFDAQAQICFSPVVNFTATAPHTICSADFNNDGKPDLATADENIGYPSNISILLGDGIGGFNAPLTFQSVKGRIYSIISADFNGDANADLVLANYDTNFVSVFLGNGSGGFNLPLNIVIGYFPTFLASADFNGDGKFDLAATVVSASSYVAIMLGNGNGSFLAPTNFPVGDGPYGMVSKDFNGDGNIDLATASWFVNKISVLLGNGNGTFQTAINSTAPSPYTLCSNDFNGDGNADVASVNWGSNNVSVLLGNGNGSFGAATNYAAGTGTKGVISADFNLDCKSDLAVSNWSSSNVSIFLGNGIGGFGIATNFSTTTNGPQYLIGKDVNLDGKIDLITADGSSGSGNSNLISVFLSCNMGPCALIGFNELNTLEQVSIYPNPSEGEINISNLKEDADFRVMDVGGRFVADLHLKKSEENQKVDVTDFENGVYFYTIASARSKLSGKLVIIK